MSLLGNLLWIILGGGIFLFFEYLLGGILACMTIIGIPFGMQLIKLSFLGLFPFGKRIRDTQLANGCLFTLFNIIWIITGGLIISLTHLVFALICGVTIIGIPFALQHIKLASVALTPFGKDVY
jgi:uncharacterized membrane protein YccF (DUF307 family)